MPKMDGIEATNHIRNFEKNHVERDRSCICAVTATTMKEQEDRCLQAGMEYFMTKPFQMKTIQQLLKRIERKWRRERHIRWEALPMKVGEDEEEKRNEKED